MEIVNYKQHYELEVLALWNETMKQDNISLAKFRKQALFDDNFDPALCYIALENQQLIVFLLATKRHFPYLERVLEPERGWINVMFVKPSHQRQGVGTALLCRAEQDLSRLGVHNITLGAYSPNYFFPGVDQDNGTGAIRFFERQGYIAGKPSFSMCKNLHGYTPDETSLLKKKTAEDAGFSFLPFRYSYALELLEFAKNEFGGGWKRNGLISMQNNTAEDCILLALDNKGEIVGFCMRMIDGNPMRFGPIGIKSTIRNYGIGSILFELMQWEMSKRGIYHLYFVSTDIPGRRFYERHGVQVFRTFIDYRKEL